MEPILILELALDATAAKTVGTVVFVAMWIAVALRLLLSRSSRYRDAARIPLEDDPVTPRHGGQGGHSHG